MIGKTPDILGGRRGILVAPGPQFTSHRCLREYAPLSVGGRQRGHEFGGISFVDSHNRRSGMKRITIMVAVVLAVTATGFAFSEEGGRRFREFLSGYKEAAAPISTTGNGTFEATISKDET